MPPPVAPGHGATPDLTSGSGWSAPASGERVSSVDRVRRPVLTSAILAALASALAATLAATGLPAGADVAGATATAPPGTPTARSFAGTPTVGPLFPPGSATHTCTASVVASAVGDLLITATHCIAGDAKGYTFSPGYHDGVAPYGSWTVVGAYASPQWVRRRSPRFDVAFLVVAPQRRRGRLRQIQAVTGADRLGTAPAPGTRVTVPAYPVGRDDRPLTCTARVTERAGYPAFDCTPYVDGTSGAPWLWRGPRGWTVVGVIGGLYQGGCEPWTSYSAPFGPDTLRTYAATVRGARTTTFPGPESDGCATGL